MELARHRTVGTSHREVEVVADEEARVTVTFTAAQWRFVNEALTYYEQVITDELAFNQEGLTTLREVQSLPTSS